MQNIYLRTDPATGNDTFASVDAPAVFGEFAEPQLLTGRTGNLDDAFTEPDEVERHGDLYAHLADMCDCGNPKCRGCED